MTPDEVLEAMKDIWIASSSARTCHLIYCISAEGTNHVHAVFEDVKTMRFSAVQNLFPGMHIEPTKGNKKQVEDYINKRGKFEEKGEVIVARVTHGEIRGAQGKRSDLDLIAELIEEGLTPKEIYDVDFGYRKYAKMIQQGFFDKKQKGTPLRKDMTNYWHLGESGSGKSFVYTQLAEQYGRDSVYMVTDYEGGGFDTYNAEPIIFLDEFRGQMPFHKLLHILGEYPVPIHARYQNVYALWNEVHITSVLPPERVYERMVETDRDRDTFEQLKRRITHVVYHAKTNGDYLTYLKPMKNYTGYNPLVVEAQHYWPDEGKSRHVNTHKDLPFLTQA